MSRTAFWRATVFTVLFLMFFSQSLAQAQVDKAQPQNSDDQTISRDTDVLAKDPNSASAYRERGGAYFRKGEFEKAISDFSAAISLNKNDSAAFSGRGCAHSEKGELDEAISDLNRAIHLSPQAVVFYQHLSDVYWKKEDWANVVTNATKVIQLHLTDPKQVSYWKGWAFVTRGWAWQYEGGLDKALEDFSESIQLSPNWDAPLTQRAEVRQKKGDVKGALADLNQAIILNPTNESAYSARDMIYRHTKDWDLAIANWNEALQSSPTNKDFLLDRAYYYLHGKKDFEHAFADYTKVIELNPRDPQGYIVRGHAYQRQNLLDKAIADFTKLIQLEPTNSAGYYRRARAYFEDDKFKEARSDYEAGIHVSPNEPFGYLELAYLLATCPDDAFRNGKEALELTKKGCALEKKQDDCAYAEAVAYAETGDFDKAVQYQKQVIEQLKKLDSNEKVVAKVTEILHLFEQHKPYHGINKPSDFE